MSFTVLAVDDSRTMRDMLEQALTEFGFDVVLAEDGLHGLEMLGTCDPDVVLTDIHMPRMDGFEFLEAALAEIGDGFARIVVAMLTTSLNPADRERAEAFAVVKDFINKPLTKEHVSHVADILGGSR